MLNPINKMPQTLSIHLENFKKVSFICGEDKTTATKLNHKNVINTHVPANKICIAAGVSIEIN